MTNERLNPAGEQIESHRAAWKRLQKDLANATDEGERARLAREIAKHISEAGRIGKEHNAAYIQKQKERLESLEGDRDEALKALETTDEDNARARLIRNTIAIENEIKYVRSLPA